MSKITNDGLIQSVWHRMLYSCTHMVSVKGLTHLYKAPVLQKQIRSILNCLDWLIHWLSVILVLCNTIIHHFREKNGPP